MRRFVEAFWGALCALSVAACGSSEFSAAPAGAGGSNPDGGGGTSGAGAGGSGNTGNTGNTGGIGSECAGPDDCSDGDPCTLDTCGANGRCVPEVPRCGRTEKCCSGACAECCADVDCS